jgi:serine/threonine protein kinase/Tfp pilus assembly protein PilF
MKFFAQSAGSDADTLEKVGECTECGAAVRVAQGLCAICLLHQGLGATGESSIEIFESVLNEAEVPDAQWRLGNYEILQEIGRGGMGVIYRARQRHSGRIVALKRVLAYNADSHEALVRFRREAKAAASLDHPNILPIYEVAESEEGMPFFSMKFATGGSLRAAASTLRDRPNECVRLMAKVARAIDYAHHEGVLHRDLQPGNVLLDSHGEPMVSDFGLAKWLLAESDLTKTLTTFGTPGYIAPEQAEDAAGNITPAADIYSLGAILFHLLTGGPPFVGANVLSVIHQAAATPAPRLRSLAPSLDRDLETILARTLERDPKARYQTAGSLAEDLERWLEGRPILARRVLVPARMWRWARRNPILASTAVICLSLGVTVIWLLSKEVIAPRMALPPEKSIAVLPFENLSDNKDNSYFVSGIQDEILSDLAKIADLKVISRTSTRLYEAGKPRNSRQIGQELGVAHLLEGSVQRSGNHLRINAQLIDTRTDSHLWAQTYDRDVADAFAIQSEIAQTIAGQLQVEISEREKAAIARPATGDLVANDLYLKAIAIWPTHESVSEREAISLLEQAVARDPRFLRAYCALARVHLSLYEGEDHTSARLQTANAVIEKAAQLQPDAGEVHLVRARYLARGLRDCDHARAELELARRTLPNDATVYFETALVDVRQGRWTEALRNFERAVELDPRNVAYLTATADIYSSMSRYREAVRFGRRALALSPHDNWLRSFLASQPLPERADIRPWRNELNAIVSENPGAAPSISEDLWLCAILERDVAAAERALATIPPEGFQAYWGFVAPREWYVGYTARIFERPETARVAFAAARAILEKQLRENPDNALTWSYLGLVKAALGEKQEAIEAGQRACELWPLSREQRWGLRTLRHLAMIYAWVGEKDLALQQLSLYAGQPSFVDYGELKLNPDWDPLRGDPRFEKLVASLAPKD